jgi:hypothetical protein
MMDCCRAKIMAMISAAAFLVPTGFALAVGSGSIDAVVGDNGPPAGIAIASSDNTGGQSVTTASAAYGSVMESFTAGTSSNSGYTPPDTNGAVGPSDIVQLINGYYGVYSLAPSVNASGVATPLASESLPQFWTNSGVTLPAASSGYNSFVSDPRVIYDPSSGHWFASSIDVMENSSSGNVSRSNDFLLAVSKNSNPLDGWTGFKVAAYQPTNPSLTSSEAGYGTTFADFPTLGITSNYVTVGANNFTVPNQQNQFSSAPAYESVLLVNKSALTGGSPSVSNFTANSALTYQSFNNLGFTNQPVNDLNGTGAASYLFSNYDASGANNTYTQNLNETRVVSASTSGGLDTNYNLAAFAYQSGEPVNGTQPGSSATIDTNDDRLSSSLTTDAKGNIWGIQSVLNPANSNLSALRWFEVAPVATAGNGSTGPDILAQGVISDPNNSLYFGSIAVNSAGKVVIGFTESGTINPSAFALIGNLTGTNITFGSPLLLHAGLAAYGNTGANRWGDYSSTWVDATNPNIFWTFQEYAVSANQWGTQIAEIAVPEPTALMILGGGLALMLLITRRHRKTSVPRAA